MQNQNNSCRMITDLPGTGSWNMSVDQALMETAGSTAQPTLRIYGWKPATLSLGYFQAYAQRQEHTESLGNNCVRRSTGGGAIMHDQEITYSLCVPSANRWSKHNTKLYDLVHEATLEALQQWNITAQLFGSSKNKNIAGNADSFLCFERRTAGDVILDGFKIGGSAQRRTRNALLQHGSILLATSKYAPQLPGIKELTGKQIDAKELTQAWLHSVNQKFNFDVSPGHLSALEFQSAQTIEAKRYAMEQWNQKR